MLREDHYRFVTVICLIFWVAVLVKCVEGEKVNSNFVDNISGQPASLLFNRNKNFERWANKLNRQRRQKSLKIGFRNDSQVTDESLGALEIISLLPTSYGKVWRSSPEEGSSPPPQFTKRIRRVDLHEAPPVQNTEHTGENTEIIENSSANNQAIRERDPNYSGVQLPLNKKYEFKHQTGDQPNLMGSHSEEIPLVMSYRVSDKNANRGNFHTYWLHSRVTPPIASERNLTEAGHEPLKTHEYVYVLENPSDSKPATGEGSRRVWFDPKFSQNHQWQKQQNQQSLESTRKDSHSFPVEFDEKLSKDADGGFVNNRLNLRHSGIAREERAPIIYNSHESKVFAVDTGRYTSNFKVIQENKRGSVPSFEIEESHEELLRPHGGKEPRAQEGSHVSDVTRSTQTEDILAQGSHVSTRQNPRPMIPHFGKNIVAPTASWRDSEGRIEYGPNLGDEVVKFSLPKLETHMFRDNSRTKNEDGNNSAHRRYRWGSTKIEHRSRPTRRTAGLGRVKPLVSANRWRTNGAVRINPETIPMLPVHDPGNAKNKITGSRLWVRARDALVDRRGDVMEQKLSSADDYGGASQVRPTGVRRQSVEEKYGSIVAGAAVAVGLAAFAVTAMGNSPMAKETLDLLPSLGTISNVFREADKRIGRVENGNMSSLEVGEPQHKSDVQAEAIPHLVKQKIKNATLNRLSENSEVPKDSNKSVSKESEIKKMSVLQTLHNKLSNLNKRTSSENFGSESQIPVLDAFKKLTTPQDVKLSGNLSMSTHDFQNTAFESLYISNNSNSTRQKHFGASIRPVQYRNDTLHSLKNTTYANIFPFLLPRRNNSINNSMRVLKLPIRTTDGPVVIKPEVLSSSLRVRDAGGNDALVQKHGIEHHSNAERGFGERPSSVFNATQEDDLSRVRQRISAETMKGDSISEVQEGTRSDDQLSNYAISTWIPLLDSRSFIEDPAFPQSVSMLNYANGTSYFGSSGYKRVVCSGGRCNSRQKRVEKRSIPFGNIFSYLADMFYIHEHDDSMASHNNESMATGESEEEENKNYEEESTRNERETNETQMFSKQDSHAVFSKNISKEKENFEVFETKGLSSQPPLIDSINKTSPRNENLHALQNYTSDESKDSDPMNIEPFDLKSAASTLDSRIEVYSSDRGKNPSRVGNSDSGNYSVTTQSQARVLSPPSVNVDHVTPATVFSVGNRSRGDDGTLRVDGDAAPLQRGSSPNESSSARPTGDDAGRRKWARNLLVDKLMSDAERGDKGAGFTDLSSYFTGKKERLKSVLKRPNGGDARRKMNKKSEETFQQSELKRIIEKYRLSKFIKELYEKKRVRQDIPSGGVDNFTQNHSIIFNSLKNESILFGKKTSLESHAVAHPLNNSLTTSRDTDVTGHIKTGSMPHKILLFLLEQYEEKLDQISRHKTKFFSPYSSEQNSKNLSEKLSPHGTNNLKKIDPEITVDDHESGDISNENTTNGFEANKLYAITDFSDEDEPVLEELIVLEHSPDFDLSHERFQRKLTPEEKEEAQGLLALFNAFLQKNLVRKRPLSLTNNNDGFESSSERVSVENLNVGSNDEKSKKDWHFETNSELSRQEALGEEYSYSSGQISDQKHSYNISKTDDPWDDFNYYSDIPEYYYYLTDSDEDHKWDGETAIGRSKEFSLDSTENSNSILGPESLMRVLLEFQKMNENFERKTVKLDARVADADENRLNSSPKIQDSSTFRSLMPAEMSADAFEEFVSDLSKSLNKHSEWSLSSNFPPVEVSIPSAGKQEGQASQVQSSDGTQSRKTGQSWDFITHKGPTSDASMSLGSNEVPEIAKEISFSNVSHFKTDHTYRQNENLFSESLDAENEEHNMKNVDSELDKNGGESAVFQSANSQNMSSDLHLGVNGGANFNDKHFPADDNSDVTFMPDESSSKMLRTLNGTNKSPEAAKIIGKNSVGYTEKSKNEKSSNASGFGVSSLLSILNPNKPDILRNINKVLDLIIGDPSEKDVNKLAGDDSVRRNYPLPTIFDFPKSRSSLLGNETIDSSQQNRQLEISDSEDKLSAITDDVKHRLLSESVDQTKSDVERSLLTPELNKNLKTSSKDHNNRFITTSAETDPKSERYEKMNPLVNPPFTPDGEMNSHFAVQDDPTEKFSTGPNSFFASNVSDTDVYQEYHEYESKYDVYSSGSEEKDPPEIPPRFLWSAPPGDGLLGQSFEERRGEPQIQNFVPPLKESQHLPMSRGAMPNSLVLEDQSRDGPHHFQHKWSTSDDLFEDYEYADEYDHVSKTRHTIGNAHRKPKGNFKVKFPSTRDFSIQPSVLLTAERMISSNRREFNPVLSSGKKSSEAHFNPSTFDVQYFNSSEQWRAITKPPISKTQTHFKSRSNQPVPVTPDAGDTRGIIIKRKLGTGTNKEMILKGKISPSYRDKSSGSNSIHPKFSTFLAQDHLDRDRNDLENKTPPLVLGSNSNRRKSAGESMQRSKFRLNDSLKTASAGNAAAKHSVEFSPVKRPGMEDSPASARYALAKYDSTQSNEDKNSLGVLTSMAANSRSSADHIFIDVGFKYPVHAEWSEDQGTSSHAGSGSPNANVTTFVINDGGVLRAATNPAEMFSSFTVDSKTTFARAQNSNDIGTPLTNSITFPSSTAEHEKVLNDKRLLSYGGEQTEDSSLLNFNSVEKKQEGLSNSPASVSAGKRLTTTRLNLCIGVLLCVFFSEYFFH